jgi:hypothetical protein
MTTNKFNWDEFKTTITYLKKGVEELYFRDVIKAATDHSIIKFDDNSISTLSQIENYIKNNFNSLSDTVEKNYVGRINEVGNYIEGLLKAQINTIGKIKCSTATLADGSAQASGYPDYLIENSNITIYADVKAFQAKTLESSLRSFYYQPTNQVKIHKDAPHCLIGFEVKSISGENKSPFKLVSYKIIDLYELKVNFKAEFNANNIEVYSLKTLFKN